MVLYWNGQNAVLAFSFAQLASVIAYTISFYIYFWYYIKKDKKDFPFKTMWEFFPNFTGKVSLYTFNKMSKSTFDSKLKIDFRNCQNVSIFLYLCCCGVS